jgi:hypothetical protein
VGEKIVAENQAIAQGCKGVSSPFSVSMSLTAMLQQSVSASQFLVSRRMKPEPITNPQYPRIAL